MCDEIRDLAMVYSSGKLVSRNDDIFYHQNTEYRKCNDD